MEPLDFQLWTGDASKFQIVAQPPMLLAEYITVFDLSVVGYKFKTSLLVILAFTAFLVIFVALKRPTLKEFFNVPLLAGLGAGFVVLFILVIPWTFVVWTIAQFVKFDGQLKRGETQFVQGRIENFHPKPALEKRYERFSVNGIEFQYADSALSVGFNNTSSEGGPIKEGLKARVWYIDEKVGRTIVKLQLAKDQS